MVYGLGNSFVYAAKHFCQPRQRISSIIIIEYQRQAPNNMTHKLYTPPTTRCAHREDSGDCPPAAPPPGALASMTITNISGAYIDRFITRVCITTPAATPAHIMHGHDAEPPTPQRMPAIDETSQRKIFQDGAKCITYDNIIEV